MDFAQRAHDHSYHLDPIVRSLLDTDFYKFLMMQFIWEHFPNVFTKWAVKNRTKKVRLVDEIEMSELRAQLDHVRTLRFTQSELIWLRGQTFYGQEGIFKNAFINTLKAFSLPEYQLSRGEEGQYVLTFEGKWWQVMLWEIYALTILNELRSRGALRRFNKSELDITYARAKVKLYDKLEKLAALDGLNLTDFGTRRRHSFLWQEHCILTACEVIGKGFTGTSNVHFAMKHGLEAKGTNAHELPMVFAALARAQTDDPAKLQQAQYDVLLKWQNQYRGNLLIGLPDTFGSTQFFENAPQWLSNWKGFRPDSKEPVAAGNEIIRFFKRKGLTDEQVQQKLVLFSDGLDVALNGQSNGTDIVGLFNEFYGIIGLGFGWGTNLTNDFIDCAPHNADSLRSISLVCKVIDANGSPTVKLSDNYDKAMGPLEEIEFYREAFGTLGVKNAPCLV